jgi:hypothetical protein
MAIATRLKSRLRPDADEASRGVVATSAVGSRYIGWLRLFRYEVRCWRGESNPELVEAVAAPRRLSSDARVARRLLDLVPTVPTPVWGRDELKAGEMWSGAYDLEHPDAWEAAQPAALAEGGRSR